MTATITDLDDFKALDPFFRIIEKGLEGIADGGHFFDLLAEDVIFDYIITTPGYPRRVEGRRAVAELYRPYGTLIVLDRCHDLAVHHDIKTGVVVLEYASEGRVVATGAPYANRYISVITIADRKVTHWRDYLDPVAAFDALGWPSRLMNGGEIDPRAPHDVDQVVATNHDHLWHRVVLREARVPREAELPG
jgi:uncharacterized protein